MNSRSIPQPEPGDSETVVTALETAAVFSARGESAEALRWLKRAAESSAEGANDARTLTLARTAAELSQVMSIPAPPASDPAAARPSRSLPKPPARPALSLGIENSAADEPSRAAMEKTDPMMARPSRPVGTPPPPSARSVNSVSVGGGASQKIAAVSGRPRSSEPSSPTSQRAPAVRAAAAVAVKSAALADDSASFRKAVRVSVLPSATEPGLYLVRLLEDGKPAPEASAEGILVLTDPASTFFSR